MTQSCFAQRRVQRRTEGTWWNLTGVVIGEYLEMRSIRYPETPKYIKVDDYENVGGRYPDSIPVFPRARLIRDGVIPDAD